MVRWWGLLCLVWAWSGVSQAGIVSRCERGGVGSKVKRYCYYVHQQSRIRDAGTVIYIFHGAAQNADSFSTYIPQFMDTFVQANGTYPVIVAPSYGPLWLMVNKTPNPLSGKLEDIRDRFIPGVESHLGLSRQVKRVYLGASMGGFNALSLALAAPNKVDRVISLCGHLQVVSPYDNLFSKMRFVSDNQEVSRLAFTGSLTLSRIHMTSRGLLDRNDPYRRILRLRQPLPFQVHIVANRFDEYGFYHGNRRVANKLRSLGNLEGYDVVRRKHCQYVAESPVLDTALDGLP